MRKKEIALVIGANSGLGREFVRQLLEEDVEENCGRILKYD